MFQSICGSQSRGLHGSVHREELSILDGLTYLLLGLSVGFLRTLVVILDRPDQTQLL